MDKIVMRDMEFYGYTGVLEEEKKNGQTFVVTVEMAFDRIKGVETDNLEDTINYAEVYDAVKEVVTTSKFDLIERLAGAISEVVLEFLPDGSDVKIRVQKPQAPIQGKFKCMEVCIERGK